MGGIALWSEIFDLVGRTPLTAHGIALSIGTDVPLDDAYLDKVAVIVERLKAPAYSEHLAFTRVPTVSWQPALSNFRMRALMSRDDIRGR